MKKLFVLGDMHFSNSREWDLESFNHFIDWFENYDFGKYEDCELLQLGDVTEKSINNGAVYFLVTKFFKIALRKFSRIYVIGGNHCWKYDVTRNSEYFSTEYLSNMSDNIKTIFSEEKFTALDGKLSILALPFKFTVSSIEEYYNKHLNESFYEEKYNIICGHVNLYDSNFPSIEGLKLKNFKFDHAVFGHIHSRIGANAKYYTGSIMPFRKSEEKTELPRCIKVYDDTNNELPEIELPIFRQYHIIDFNKNKPEFERNSGTIVHIYELVNCKNDLVGEKTYPNFYIKKSSTIKSIDDCNTDSIDNDNNILLKDDYTVLEQMCKDNNIILKRGTKVLLKELLSSK